jgi:hypothetical protein
MFPKNRSRSKYRNKKTVIGNKTFASKAEARLYEHLKFREDQGEITNLLTQVQVHLTDADILFKPDFSYIENDVVRYCEMKGFSTAVWAIKKRLWKFYGPGVLDIYNTACVLTETIKPRLK